MTAKDFLDDYLTGQNVSNFTNPADEIPARSAALLDSRSKENCLFLDVIVPQMIFNATTASETVAKNTGEKCRFLD